MSTLFVLKNVPVFFFKNAEKYGQNCIKVKPPFPLSLSITKQHRISILESQNTARVSFTLLVGGGDARRGRGGGQVDFQERVWSLVYLLVEKKLQGHFCTEKESACQISADSEQLGKLLQNSHIGLACMEPFNYCVYSNLRSPACEAHFFLTSVANCWQAFVTSASGSNPWRMNQDINQPARQCYLIS